MFVKVLIILISIGVIYLLIAPKPENKKVVIDNTFLSNMGVSDNGVILDRPGKLPPPPSNKLPLSHTGQHNLPSNVPSTESQLLQQPAYPSLRIGA